LAEQYQAISRAAFCAWLRDIKKLTPEEVLNHHNLESLKTEFAQTQQTTQTVQPTNWPNN
jgi:Fe-S cluster biosynthesis and repair protein YggX